MVFSGLSEDRCSNTREARTATNAHPTAGGRPPQGTLSRGLPQPTPGRPTLSPGGSEWADQAAESSRQPRSSKALQKQGEETRSTDDAGKAVIAGVGTCRATNSMKGKVPEAHQSPDHPWFEPLVCPRDQGFKRNHAKSLEFQRARGGESPPPWRLPTGLLGPSSAQPRARVRPPVLPGDTTPSRAPAHPPRHARTPAR